MSYDRSGPGVESPYEVAWAAWLLAHAEAMSKAAEKAPQNMIFFQGWFGSYGFSDPCYHYQGAGACPPEVREQGATQEPETEGKPVEKGGGK